MNVTLLTTTFLITLFSINLQATTYTSVRDGQWNDPTTWATNSVPFSGNEASDEIIIAHHVTIDDELSLKANTSIIVQAGSSLMSTKKISFLGDDNQLLIEADGQLICDQLDLMATKGAVNLRGYLECRQIMIHAQNELNAQGQILVENIELNKGEITVEGGSISVANDFKFDQSGTATINNTTLEVGHELQGNNRATIYVDGESTLDIEHLLLSTEARIIGTGTGGMLYTNNSTINSGFISCVDNACHYNANIDLPTSLNLMANTDVPVQLTEFAAHNEEEIVMLEWTTTRELDNDYFTIEKSYDGTSWFVLARVQGAGTSEDVHHYAHEDILNGETATFIHYRLRQTDFNGLSTYFNNVMIEVPTLELEDVTPMQTFPNPVIDFFQFRVANLDLVSKVRLVNAMGAEVAVSIQPQADSYYVELPNALPGGTYFLQMVEDGQLKTEKILVARY